MARPDFRSQAAARLAAERTEHTPALLDLLRPGAPGSVTQIHHIDVERISAAPDQPRRHFDPDALQDLAASIREHGILQPVLVRPSGDGHFQLVAGERRWRAARIAGLREVPAIVGHIDDEAALEIAIIENLQREDISPLEEAALFERLTTQHGYSLRKLAQKLGKDKGYVENRLRLVGAPPEVRELVATRRDTLSAAYELMKVTDPGVRRALAAEVAVGELSLARLRRRIAELPTQEEEPPVAGMEWLTDTPGSGPAESVAADLRDDAILFRLEPEPELEWVQQMVEPAEAEVMTDAVPSQVTVAVAVEPQLAAIAVEPETTAADEAAAPTAPVDIDLAARQLAQAIDELVAALLGPEALATASSAERQRFAKYLTINKIKLENAIAVVRVGGEREVFGIRGPRR